MTNISSYPILNDLGRVVKRRVEPIHSFTEEHSHVFSFKPPFQLGDVVSDPEYFQTANVKRFIGNYVGEVAQPVLLVNGNMRWRAGDIGYPAPFPKRLARNFKNDRANPPIFSIVANWNKYQLQQTNGNYKVQIKLNISLAPVKNCGLQLGLYFQSMDVLILQNSFFHFLFYIIYFFIFLFMKFSCCFFLLQNHSFGTNSIDLIFALNYYFSYLGGFFQSKYHFNLSVHFFSVQT